MQRPQLAALAAVALVVAFALGFFPQWSRARTLAAERDAARRELRFARMEGVLGAALAESLRSNYERSRQLMAGFFTDLQQRAGEVEDATKRRELDAILAQRDEVITLLSRAEPESTQRLMLIYTRYFAAMDPAGRSAAVTPSPPAQ
ncbi:MAG TPA: hypothetical protein VHG51_03185 [Longimicrobiaceae bacterium]|nr:hypothetical protein [Longimicrobiaceae bacterium]